MHALTHHGLQLALRETQIQENTQPSHAEPQITNGSNGGGKDAGDQVGDLPAMTGGQFPFP